MFLEITNGRGQLEEDIKRVEGCLKAACDALSNTLFEELIESIITPLSGAPKNGSA